MIAVICVAALLIPNLLLYGLPGTALRSSSRPNCATTNACAMLAQRDVRLVYGNYVWVYHLNFDTYARIAAV